MDTAADELETAKRLGADEALLSGEDAVTRIKDITRGQGAELVLDMVAGGARPCGWRPRWPGYAAT